MTDYVTDAEATRAIKAALRKAFPDAKISVTRGGAFIEWTDDGPTVEQVKSALIAANVVTTWRDFRDDLVLQVPGNSSIWFDRYNVAERAAYQQDLARRIEENEQRRQRENEVVNEAAQAKRTALAPPSSDPKQVETGPEAFKVFEELRRSAENDVNCNVERKFRPSWAPPLILEDELLAACIELGRLKADDKPIARLWATFADPKAKGRALRKQISDHTLSGVVCRGFQLHAGGERGATSDILFEAQRVESGEWQFGPRISTYDYHSPRCHDWERAIAERERLQSGGFSYLSPDEVSAGVARATKRIAEIDEQDRIAAAKFYRGQQLRVRVVELATARVLDFAGAPGVQMALAGRLWGHCFNCGRALTDPISLERGIGPECLGHAIQYIRDLHDDGVEIPRIARKSGMPEDFVTAVLAEPRPKPKPAPLQGFTSTHITGGYECLEIDGKLAVLNPEHTGFLCTHDTQAELFAWIDEQRRERYAAKQNRG